MSMPLRPQSRRWTKGWRVLVPALLIIVPALLVTTNSFAVAVITPLEQSGLAPLWQENFTNGSIDRMQYSWAKGNNAALTSFVTPGAVYLGKNGGTIQIEQEINNFKGSAGEARASTLEFDVFSPFAGNDRISVRPRRVGDMVTLNLGQSGDRTMVSFREDGVDVPYAELTGPSRGWAHIVYSYRQFVQGGTTYADMVIAVNGEVHEHTAVSGIVDPDYETYWANSATADGWSSGHSNGGIKSQCNNLCRRSQLRAMTLRRNRLRTLPEKNHKDDLALQVFSTFCERTHTRIR
jgi:hypothetical protein